MVGITAVLTAVMAVCMEATADTADIPADMAAMDGPTAKVIELTANIAATSANHITQEAVTQLANTEVDTMAEGSAEAETTEDITVGTTAVSPAAKHVLQTPTSPDYIYLLKAAGRRAMVMVMEGGRESRSNAYIP